MGYKRPKLSRNLQSSIEKACLITVFNLDLSRKRNFANPVARHKSVPD